MYNSLKNFTFGKMLTLVMIPSIFLEMSIMDVVLSFGQNLNHHVVICDPNNKKRIPSVLWPILERRVENALVMWASTDLTEIFK